MSKMGEESYPFYLVRQNAEGKSADKSALLNRPFAAMGNSFKDDAKRFVPGEELEISINTAIAVGEPLLITGEPGTGKTQAAYYAAYKLDSEPVIHFQVKSDSSAADLLYYFDSVRYFYEASIAAKEGKAPNKANYIEPRAMWQAISSETPRVLLIDEIDKAPRDFPNDLLHEIDKMEFTVAETGDTVSASKGMRPIVFITSNSERRLPEPFLRRCVYHHIKFDEAIVARAVERRMDEYKNLDERFVQLAVQRFLALRNRNLRKRPSTSELLIWLRVLSITTGLRSEQIDGADLAKLPYLGVLLKDHQDIEDLGAK